MPSSFSFSGTADIAENTGQSGAMRRRIPVMILWISGKEAKECEDRKKAAGSRGISQGSKNSQSRKDFVMNCANKGSTS